MKQIILDCTGFHPWFYKGGVSLYMQEILSALPQEYKFHAIYNSIQSGSLEPYRDSILTSHQIQGNMITWRDIGVRKIAINKLKSVWFPTQFTSWFPIVPSVVTIHDLASFLAWNHLDPKAKLLMPASLVNSSFQATKIIVVSESTASDLGRFLPWTKRKIMVAKHGLPSDVRIKSNEIGITSCDQNKPITFLFLDGANPRKRLDLCLLALNQMGWNNIVLRITGNISSVTKRIRAILGELPMNVVLTGFVSREALLDEISASDILLYPSDFEGFGFPIIEGMAFGTSVVCLPGNAEKEIGGIYANYAALSDVKSMILAINKSIERCRDFSWKSQLISHARSFHWDESVSIHSEAFSCIL